MDHLGEVIDTRTCETIGGEDKRQRRTDVQYGAEEDIIGCLPSRKNVCPLLGLLRLSHRQVGSGYSCKRKNRRKRLGEVEASEAELWMQTVFDNLDNDLSPQQRGVKSALCSELQADKGEMFLGSDLSSPYYASGVSHGTESGCLRFSGMKFIPFRFYLRSLVMNFTSLTSTVSVLRAESIAESIVVDNLRKEDFVVMVFRCHDTETEKCEEGEGPTPGMLELCESSMAPFNSQIAIQDLVFPGSHGNSPSFPPGMYCMSFFTRSSLSLRINKPASGSWSDLLRFPKAYFRTHETTTIRDCFEHCQTDGNFTRSEYLARIQLVVAPAVDSLQDEELGERIAYVVNRSDLVCSKVVLCLMTDKQAGSLILATQGLLVQLECLISSE